MNNDCLNVDHLLVWMRRLLLPFEAGKMAANAEHRTLSALYGMGSQQLGK